MAQTNQTINLKQENDKFHVMLNENLTNIQNYRQEITMIDASLTKTKVALQNVPGVSLALKGIDDAQQLNYQRLAKLQIAEQAANDLFTAMGEKYANLTQAINDLPNPEAAAINPQLTMNPDSTQKATDNYGQ